MSQQQPVQGSHQNLSQRAGSANPALWADLEATFQRDLPTTTELLELLQQERTALEQRDYDRFQQIIGQKHQLLKALEIHALARQQLLSQAGFQDENSTLDAAEAQAPQVASHWRQLGEQWLRCQELNEINERIAKRTKLVVSQVLDMLRGHNNETKLYTSRGDARRSNGSRTITSA